MTSLVSYFLCLIGLMTMQYFDDVEDLIMTMEEVGDLGTTRARFEVLGNNESVLFNRKGLVSRFCVCGADNCGDRIS